MNRPQWKQCYREQRIAKKEIWRPVLWYEWIYDVSNLWRVKSYLTSKILKWINNDWYRQVRLYKKWICNTIKIHILVAKSFIKNPENKPQVNHKNWIKHDNHIDNLEWVTAKENIQHAFDTGLNKVTKNHHFYTNHPMVWKFWKLHHNSKEINQYTLDWKFIKKWYSISEAGRNLWIHISSISNCCKSKKWSKSAGGFIWKFNH